MEYMLERQDIFEVCLQSASVIHKLLFYFISIRWKTWQPLIILVSDCLKHKQVLPESLWPNEIILDWKHQWEILYKNKLNNKHGNYQPFNVFSDWPNVSCEIQAQYSEPLVFIDGTLRLISFKKLQAYWLTSWPRAM